MTITTPAIPDVVPERAPRTPGRVFTDAVAAHGLEASVDFDTTITASLASLRRKPRYPARNLLKVVDLSRQPRRFYWHESPPPPGGARIGGSEVRPELASRFHMSPIPKLLPTTAWVQVPPGLWEDAPAFESFVDGRLVFRLGTAENHTILGGEAGLLSQPGIVRLTSAGPFASTILAACNEIEQMGCTPDGLIVNPVDFYRLLSGGTLMHDLEQHGVLIVRTRLVEPGTAIVGDFAKGAQLVDAGRSVIRFAEPPPGTFAEPGIALMAEIHERVVVNLPTNFYVVSL